MLTKVPITISHTLSLCHHGYFLFYKCCDKSICFLSFFLILNVFSVISSHTDFIAPFSTSKQSRATNLIQTDLSPLRHKNFKIEYSCLLSKNNQWTSHITREAFLSYFHKNQHEKWNSSSVIPEEDTDQLLFINAGMNQFKPMILKRCNEDSPTHMPKRAVNSQKCIRAGGKNNDLEDVGKDGYHHTFFEMLGSWSFGDYDKAKAIELAWDLLINHFKLDQNRFYVTYFGGDENLISCPPDWESKNEWEKYLPHDHILPFGAKHNFWEMSNTGPCGPCTEIHYDLIGERNAASLVNSGDPYVIELWNLVFMQFNRENDGQLNPLSTHCIDTGMGLERLLSILQNVTSNYHTDLFTPIFDEIQTILPVPRNYTGNYGEEDKELINFTYRTIADHIRCLTVAISDNVKPSSTGRGYVLRKIIRRAVGLGQQFLHAPCDSPWLYLLVDCVLTTIGDYYQDLNSNKYKIKNVIKDEELLYHRTLLKGQKRYSKLFSKHLSGNNSTNIFPSNIAFKLHSTYGLPLHVILSTLKNQDLQLNMEEYEKLAQNHRAISKKRKISLQSLTSNEKKIKNESANFITNFDHKDSDKNLPATPSSSI